MVGDEVEAGPRRAPSAASPPASPPAAPAPGGRGRRARRAARGGSRTCSGDAPFCGAKTSAASRNRASHVAGDLERDPQRRKGRSASTAPAPPSVEATPPTATTIRSAPASSAAATARRRRGSSRRSGSFPAAPPASESPHARAASIVATPSVEPPPGVDRLTERTGHARRPVRAAEDVERPLAAVRERELDGVPAGQRGAGRDRGGRLRADSVPRNLSGAGEQARHTRFSRSTVLPWAAHNERVPDAQPFAPPVRSDRSRGGRCYRYGNRHREVVQRRQGVWLHHPGRRRQGHFRAFQRDRVRGLQDPRRGREGRVRGVRGAEGPRGAQRPDLG